MNHMLNHLGRLVMASQKERDENENNRGVGWRQLNFPILVVTANPARSTHTGMPLNHCACWVKTFFLDMNTLTSKKGVQPIRKKIYSINSPQLPAHKNRGDLQSPNQSALRKAGIVSLKQSCD